MKKLSYKNLEADMMALANPTKAKLLSGFFKTGPGQYGEGDIFLGITVPQTREMSKKYTELDLSNLQKLLNSKIHEIRLCALLVLVKKYKIGNEAEKKAIAEFYLANAKNINNWDLVDLTAPKIFGEYLIGKPHKVLYDLVKSDNLWERRIAVLSTFTFIREKDFADIMKLAEKLLNDKHDLMHKAVGWMLREMGKRDKNSLVQFLNLHYKNMPRTMLRYAIEKFDNEERLKYLKK
ncbi:MAG: DNA alkylation repair protein [Candidatus Falkowbacteria bacterium]